MSEEKEDSSENRIQAVENAFDIVEMVHSARGCTASHVEETLDLPRSTAYIYLKTLVDLGFLQKQDGEYHVGVQFLKYGGWARHNIDMYQVTRKEVDKLAAETQSIATIGCEDGGMRVLLYLTESGDAVTDNPPIGEYTEMHWTALGKALLAEKSDAEIAALVEQHGLPAGTENTITDLDALLETVDEIRSRGYSVENEERSEGVKAVGTTLGFEDPLYGNIAIAVAGPTSRFTEERIEDELSTALQETANVIELRHEHYR